MDQKIKKSIASPRLRGALTGLLALSLGASMVTAQDFAGKKINSVQVRYSGAKTVDEARIRNLMSVKTGQKFNAEKLDDDIRSLVESGLVDDVKMSGENRGSGMGLIVEVVTRPALAGVGFAGNANFTDKKLLKELKELKPGAPLSDAAIFEARQSIEKFYQDFGYPDVVVSHRLQSTDRKGYSDLVLTVDEGVHTEVYKIHFQGNNTFPSHVLKSEMKTKEKGIFSFLTKSGRIDTSRLEEDEELILDFYRSKGYLRASSNGFQRVVDAKGKSSLVMKINEGIKYSISAISFAGKMSVFTPEELAPVLTLNAGDSFSSKKMRKDIRTIRSYYGSRGYADATVDPDIQNAGQGKVKVVYRVTEGSRYKVGRITIEGNNKTRDKVIRREIPLKPGDNFNTVDVETTRKRLEGLNYFNSVIAEGSPSSQKGYRDIDILVNEKNTGQLSFGLGFSSIDNIVGYINIEETNFDIANPHGFRGGGQRFGLNLRLGSERQDFTLSLTEPWFMGRRLSLGGELFYKGSQNLSDQYEQRNVGAAVTLRKPLGKRSYVRGGLRFEKINVDVDSDVTVASDFAQFDGDFTRPALSLNYVYDGRDAVSRTRKGHKVDLGVTAVLDALGGDSDTFILSASGAKYWNLWFDSVLEVNGSVTAVESSGTTPIYDRQFLGGARNLRGFEYRDVGPRDAETEDVFGGDTSAHATVEWTFPLVSTVRGAVFYDAGIVNEDSFDFSISDYYSDAGLGIRMNLPFGPIALDYAFPLEAPDDLADKGAQFNFYVDYEF